MTTPELKRLIESVDEIIMPIKICIADIELGWEEDVADHYDCVAELKQLIPLLEEAE